MDGDFVAVIAQKDRRGQEQKNKTSAGSQTTERERGPIIPGGSTCPGAAVKPNNGGGVRGESDPNF
jgi:hypothetical protein